MLDANLTLNLFNDISFDLAANYIFNIIIIKLFI